MPIRPIDIRRKEFRNGFRGYDANQVDDFLDTVADEFERTYNENQRMREEISGLRDRLQQFEDLEGSIRAALVHAERAANDLRRSANQEAEDARQGARREADFTIREAQNRSQQMLADSAARIERVQDSYEALQDAKRSFGNDFRHLLTTYMDMIEGMELSSARDIEASLRDRLDTESIAVVREAATERQESPADTPEAERPAFETAAPDEERGAGEAEAPGEDPQATARIEPEASAVAGPEATGQEAPEAEQAPRTFTTDEERADEQETQVLRPEEPTSLGPLADEPVREEPAVDEQGQAAPAADEAPDPEPETTEPEVEPSTTRDEAGDETAAETRTDPEAADEVEREEPALAEESRSQEFFDRENTGREGSDSRIFRASRFLRRRD